MNGAYPIIQVDPKSGNRRKIVALPFVHRIVTIHSQTTCMINYDKIWIEVSSWVNPLWFEIYKRGMARN